MIGFEFIIFFSGYFYCESWLILYPYLARLIVCTARPDASDSLFQGLTINGSFYTSGVP